MLPHTHLNTEGLGEKYSVSLAVHREPLRETLTEFDGAINDSSFCVLPLFSNACDCVAHRLLSPLN